MSASSDQEGLRPSLDDHAVPPLHERSIVYLCIGLLGVALFLAALFSMLGGKATPVNLIIGLMGILFMTPAGGFFLLKWLGGGEVSHL